MEELTMILFCACFVVGGAVMIIRKLGHGAYMLSLVMSVIAIGAIVSDDSVLNAEGFDLTLMLVPSFVIFLYSLWGMLFGFGKDES